MNIPANLKYNKSHEWVKETDGGLFEIGISDFAQKELGDIVYINLPLAGDEIKAGKPFADIESVKAVSDIQSPVTGTVREVNDALVAAPDLINRVPYESWLIKAEGTLGESLLSAPDYEKLIKK